MEGVQGEPSYYRGGGGGGDHFNIRDCLGENAAIGQASSWFLKNLYSLSIIGHLKPKTSFQKSSELLWRVAFCCSVLLQPFLVGKAVVPLQRWLAAPSFSSQCQLDVRSSALARGVSEDDPVVGKLEVRD